MPFFSLEGLFNCVIALVNQCAGGLIEFLAFGRQFQINAALVVGRLQAHGQNLLFQAGQNAGQAGTEDAGLIGQILKVESAVFR